MCCSTQIQLRTPNNTKHTNPNKNETKWNNRDIKNDKWFAIRKRHENLNSVSGNQSMLKYKTKSMIYLARINRIHACMHDIKEKQICALPCLCVDFLIWISSTRSTTNQQPNFIFIAQPPPHKLKHHSRKKKHRWTNENRHKMIETTKIIQRLNINAVHLFFDRTEIEICNNVMQCNV